MCRSGGVDTEFAVVVGADHHMVRDCLPRLIVDVGCDRPGLAARVGDSVPSCVRLCDSKISQSGSVHCECSHFGDCSRTGFPACGAGV